MKLQASDILLPHPSNLNSFCLGPRAYEDPTDLISCEANRIPFMSQDINLNSWADCLRAWPNPPESWITWYSRVAKTYMPLWQELNIADALSLSLSPLDKDENLLKTIGYFWSDTLNCLLFGHGPMIPTLLDVTMITGVDIKSPDPAAHRMVEVPFKLSSKIDCKNWSTYMNHHMKTKGPISKKEHTAFLNLWL